jgi:hypothetical protein
MNIPKKYTGGHKWENQTMKFESCTQILAKCSECELEMYLTFNNDGSSREIFLWQGVPYYFVSSCKKMQDHLNVKDILE